jgi:hypothetical protein
LAVLKREPASRRRYGHSERCSERCSPRRSHPQAPTARDREAAEILECIWFSTLIGWATGADADDHTHDLMQTSARALLGTRP